jgi:hypothetical protein
MCLLCSSECVPSLLHSRSSRSFFLWFCSLGRIFSLNFSATGAARSWIFCWVRSLISSFGTRSLSFSRLLVLRSCFHFLRQGFGAGGFSLPSAPGFWRPVRQVFLVPHQFFWAVFFSRGPRFSLLQKTSSIAADLSAWSAGQLPIFFLAARQPNFLFSVVWSRPWSACGIHFSLVNFMVCSAESSW